MPSIEICLLLLAISQYCVAPSSGELENYAMSYSQAELRGSGARLSANEASIVTFGRFGATLNSICMTLEGDA